MPSHASGFGGLSRAISSSDGHAGGRDLFRTKSLFLGPPTSALAAFAAGKPARYFCRSEQAALVVAAVRILAELTRTSRRHRTAHQGQVRCFAQQIGPSRSLHCRRTASAARRDLDRAKVAGAVRPFRVSNWRMFVSGVLARSFAKQPFQYFYHDCAPVIDLATMHGIGK